MEKAYQINIIRRFILSFCFLVLAFISYGIFTLYDLRKISDLTRTIYDHPLVVSNAALQANVSIAKMHRSMKDVVLFDSPERIAMSINALNEKEKAVYRHLDTVRDKILGQEGRSLESETRSLFDAWRPIRQEVIALVNRGQREEAAHLTIGKGADHVANLDQKMFALTDYARKKASTFMSDTERLHSRIIWASMVFLLSGILSSSLVALYTLKQSAKSVREFIESEQLLVNAMDISPVGIVLMTTEGNFYQVNQAFCAMTGYTKEELQNMTLNEVSHPDDFEIGPQIIKKLIRKEIKKAIFDKKYLTKDGRVLDVNLTTALLRDRQGDPLYFFTIAQDVTEQKEVLEALKRSEEKYRQIFDTNKAVKLMIDPESGAIIEANEAACTYYGYTKSEMLALKIIDLNVLTPEKTHMEMQKAMNENKLYFNFSHRMASGEVRDVELYSGPVNLGDRTILYSIIHDVTDRKLAENELKHHRNKLEEMVAERTRELEDKTQKIEKTQQALTYLLEDMNEARAETERLNQDLEAVNKELKDFAYIVSHDLKAPLRAVSQLAYWIAEDHGDSIGADGKEKVELLISRVKRMDGLISGILKYSRAGRIGEKAESIDLKVMLDEVIEALAPPKNIHISIDDELPEIIGHRTGMEQVFQNLLGNAIKFVHKHDGVVRVGCMDEGSQWKFSMADNGPGIAEKYHARIFQIFQTLAPRDEHESTGIGLTIVKKIIEQHGGKIWVESKEGEGATFYFTLPKK